MTANARMTNDNYSPMTEARINEIEKSVDGALTSLHFNMDSTACRTQSIIRSIEDKLHLVLNKKNSKETTPNNAPEPLAEDFIESHNRLARLMDSNYQRLDAIYKHLSELI